MCYAYCGPFSVFDGRLRLATDSHVRMIRGKKKRKEREVKAE